MDDHRCERARRARATTSLFSDRDSVDAASINAFAISARSSGHPASPYLALVLPLDQDLKDLVGFMITAGIEIRM